MKLTLEPEFEKTGAGQIVRGAAPLLESKFGKNAAHIAIDMRFCSGRPESVRITVSDDLARMVKNCSTEVPIGVLRNPERVFQAIYETWTNLLRLESEKSLDFLKANVPSD